MHLLLPNVPFDVENLQPGERLYFLAGPIKGAGDWQKRAIELLAEKDPNCYIACPCRYSPEHALFQHAISVGSLPNNTLPAFPHQTAWERYYMRHAVEKGGLLFWLAKEDPENPRDPATGPYAQDSYGELGRWSIKSAERMSRAHYDHFNLQIGADRAFHGLKVIKRNYDADHSERCGKEIDFPIHETLEAVIEECVRKAKKMNPQPMFNHENC